MLIKSMLQWSGPFHTQMPFAINRSGVSMFLQCFGNGDLFEGQMLVDVSIQEPLERVILAAGQPVSKVQRSRIFACHQTGPGGRTDMACGISICELHTFLCKLINIGRIIECTAIAPCIGPPHIIYQEKDHIELLLLRCSAGVEDGY